jgi:hypothetical protein
MIQMTEDWFPGLGQRPDSNRTKISSSVLRIFVDKAYVLWLLDKQTLNDEEYLEVTHVVFFATDCNIWWLTHVVAAVKPTNQITTLIDTKHCWRYAVNSNDVSWRNQIPTIRKFVETINLIERESNNDLFEML